MSPKVTISETGRDGQVKYSEGLRAIAGYFELGGGDVVTIISMGSREEWARTQAWAIERRNEILAFVANEVIRQRAPTCVAEINGETGVILLRVSPGAAPDKSQSTRAARAKAAGFVRRYGDLRAWLALAVLAIALIVGGLVALGTGTLTVAPAKGVPLNQAARFGATDRPMAGGVASLIQSTDPHLPNWTGRGGGETANVSILLIPLDGGPASVVPVASGLTPGALSLARIIGSDGRTLWFDAAGLYGVRLSDRKLVEPEDLRAANPALDVSLWEDPRGMDIVDGKLHAMRIDRSAAVDVDPETWVAAPAAPKPSNQRFIRTSPDDHLAAGLVIAPDVWLGLHTRAELAGAYKPGKWVRPVESADRTKEPRRLSLGALQPSSDGQRFRIRSMMPTGGEGFIDAAFLRTDRISAPFKLAGPASALMIHTSAPGRTVMVSRIDDKGTVVWSADTGLDRFTLKQILPDAGVVALVGERPPVPGKLSEPIVVLLDALTGKATTHSLWR